jgi:hypothetical protein
MSDSLSFNCPNCQVGICHPVPSLFLSVHQGYLVSVPDIPAWQCDVCQFQEFDRDRLAQLDHLLGEAVPVSDDVQRGNLKLSTFESPDSTTVRRAKP